MTLENQHDIPYRDICKIQYRLISNWPEVNLGISIALIISLLFFILSIFNSESINNVFLIWAGRACFIVGIILVVSGFRKKEYCQLFDKNENFITTIKVDLSNEKNINAALDTIKHKSPDVNETDPDNPFPEAKYLFEFIAYDIPDFLSKSTTRFYEEELIDYEKSATDEVVTRIKYNDLSNNIIRGKQGNSRWGSLSCFLISLSTIPVAYLWLFVFTSSFYKIEFRILISSAIAFLALGLLSIFLGFIKEELIFFLNDKGRCIYLMKVTRSNKQKVEEILQFIQSKINPQQINKPIAAQNEK